MAKELALILRFKLMQRSLPPPPPPPAHKFGSRIDLRWEISHWTPWPDQLKRLSSLSIEKATSEATRGSGLVVLSMQGRN
jgi:hypothetical protein